MAEEFVQVIKLKVDDSELVAAVKKFREALGDGNMTAGLEKNLQKANKAASDTAKQARKITDGMKEATKETNGLTSAFDRMKGAVTGLVAAYAGFKGISALVGFGKGSIESFNIQNRAERMLEFGMRQNGTASRSGELKKFASTLQQNTMYGDEALLTAAAGWQNKIRGVDNSKRMMSLVADYAAKSTGGGAVDAGAMRGFSQQLMQALSGRAISLKAQGFDISAIEELNERRRKGQKITEDMEVEALERVLAPVRGMASELANTDEGKILQLKNTIGDMREEVGRELLPIVGELASSMKDNLPVLKTIFEGLRDVIKSFLETIKKHIGEIRTFALVFSDVLKLFAQAPVEIIAFAGAMKLIGPAMLNAKMSALETGAAFNVMGKVMRGILKGGLMALTIWAVEKIAELGDAGMKLMEEKGREQKRKDYYYEHANAMKYVKSEIDFQKALGLTKEQIAEAREKMKSIPAGIDMNNVRDPRVAMLFAGLDKKQIDWMHHEFNRRTWLAKAENAMKAMNSVGENTVSKDPEDSLKRQMEIELAGLTKGDTYNNTITVNNSITTDSDMTVKIIKEQLRIFTTSQLNFTSRTTAAKAFAV